MAAEAPTGRPSDAAARDRASPAPTVGSVRSTPLDAAVSGPVARIVVHYAAALIVVGLAIVARLALTPILGSKLPYITFFAGVMLAAYLGGPGPGVLATLICAAVSVRFFLPPLASLRFDDPADALGLLLFVVLSLFITTIITLQRRARAQATAASAEARVSEAQARSVLERVSDSFYALDREWRFTYVNQQATQYFGRPADALLGRVFWEVMPEKVGTIFEESFRRAAGDGVPVQFEGHSPVTHRWIDVHAYPSQSGLSVFFRDIGERLALKVGEARLSAILNSAADAIITIDQHEHITLFSAGAERIFRCAADTAVGQPIDRFIPERFRPGHHAHIQSFGATGVSMRPMGGERVLAAVRADGGEFPMEASISQSNVGGEKLYTVILRDVTERVRADAEREDLLERARVAAADADRANRAKDEFLATVSHELRTPLTPILAWTTLLRNRTLDEQTNRKGLETIERAAKSQAKLVEDLLDVSRIIAGKVRLDVRRIDLSAVIDAAIESLRPAADAKGIQLHTVLDPRAGRVAGDQERLQQVTWNLVSNAIKFTPKSGHVHVVLQRINSHVELVVRDTGAGIDPEFLPYVFDRFRQHDASTTRVHGGLGLGLAIVRHLVELHGGSVACESPGRDQGAVFTVKLPLTAVQSEPRPDDVHPVVEESLTSLDTGQSLAGTRVLVIDDEQDTVDVIAAVLRGAGAEVATALSGRSALDLIRTAAPDVIVSDVGMPEEDGYALIRAVRALPPEQGGRIPALALTAYTRTEDRVRVLASGFQMHVAKPVDPAELIATVQSLRR